MATLARRRREFDQREQRILDTTQELIQRDGLLNLQMTRLAEACDYAVGTLYQHFAKKEDLLLALTTRNFLSRMELFEQVPAWPGPTRERLLAICLADVLVLDRYPEMFRLAQFVFTDVVWGAASAERRQDALTACQPIGDVVDDIVNEALARGDLQPGALSPMPLTLGSWALTTGMHSLVHTEGVLDLYGIRRPYRLLFHHLNHLLNGQGWQPLLTPVDEASISAQLERLCRDVFDTEVPACLLPAGPDNESETAKEAIP